MGGKYDASISEPGAANNPVPAAGKLSDAADLANPQDAGLAKQQSVATPDAERLHCYSGFELSKECISARGLDQKVADYEHKIKDAMHDLEVSYKFGLRVVASASSGPYWKTPDADTWTDVVRDENMRNSAFILSVKADFLEKKPDILLESSAHHEVCHVKNDDLEGYHRQGNNIEAAEEKCVLNAVGEDKYKQYLQAYTKDKRMSDAWNKAVFEKVRDLNLVPAPTESDDADKRAAKFFKTHADGREHLLVYNGELRDITGFSTRDRAWEDHAKLSAVIKEGKPMIFFHNHPDEGTSAMYPSRSDYGAAGMFLFKVLRDDPNLKVEFRVQKPGQENTSVAYGLKGPALDEIRKLAFEYKDAVAHQMDGAPIESKTIEVTKRLADESMTEYLQFACPVDLSWKDPEICKTRPQNFIWPSTKFFLQDRPQE